MVKLLFFPFLAFLGFWNPENSSNSVEFEKVILVDIDIPSEIEAKKCYLGTYDKKRVEVQVELDDPLANLQDFELEEDPIEPTDCFFPEMKIIYSNYTYAISLYCGSIQKYKNSTPFVASQVKEPCDFRVTESMLIYLQKIHKKYFGVSYNPQSASKIVKSNSIGGNTDDIVVPDDKDDDEEITKDAIDKEGWFDDLKDPDDENVYLKIDED